MITISGSAESSAVIKKSKFFGFAHRVDSEAQAQTILEQHRKKHHDATHNCFAYVLQSGEMRYSDDGEPQGTAGLPMLDVIRKGGLTDVLVISTRYFGGTLLGAGGLVRAYTQSAADALAAAQKVQVIACSVLICTFSYHDWALAEKKLTDAGFMIDSVDYAGDVSVTIAALPGAEDELQTLVTNISQGKTAPAPQGTRNIERPV